MIKNSLSLARKILFGYFVLLFLVYVWIALDYTWKLRIWSPIDEIAQYDYIDKISSGHFPVPGEKISDYTADLSINYFDWIKDNSFNGTKESMGLSGLSYEVHQPPFYYLVMALPNLIVKALPISPWMKIKFLRETGVLAQVIAAIIIGACIYKCRRYADIHPLWSLIVPVVILIPGWEWRSPINNGNFALLTVSLSLFFMLVYLGNQEKHRPGVLSVLFASLSFLTKYTYGLLLVLILGVYLIIFWKNRNHEKGMIFWKQALPIFSPLVIVFLYFVFNVFRFGFGDILGSKAVASLMASQMIIGTWGFGLAKLLIVTAFSIPYLKVQPPWTIIFLTGCGLTAVQAAWLFLKGKHRGNSLYVMSLGVVAIIMVLTWLLSKVSPTVDWGFFRHFYGFIGFWLIAPLGFGFRSGVVQKVMTGILIFAIAYPAVVYIFR
jgi:hypothetical protein